MAVEGENTTKLSNKIGDSVILLIRTYEEARNLFTIIVSLKIILILLAIIINATICYIMLRGKRYKRNSSNFFITHLSILELVYRLLVFPFTIYFAVPAAEIYTFQCKAVTLIGNTSASAIFVSLVAIASDRYQSIVNPLKKLKSERKPVVLVCLVWLYAAIVSCPVVISTDSIPVQEIPEARGMDYDECADKKLCDIPQNPLGQSSTTLFFLLAFVVPLAIIFLLYTNVAIVLHHRGNNGKMHQVAARSKSKAVRMLIITVFGYVLSLGPATVLAMVRSYGVFNETPSGVLLLVTWLVEFASYSSSLGNPLIYAYYNGDFRKELLRVCRRKNRQQVNSYAVSFVNSNTNN